MTSQTPLNHKHLFFTYTGNGTEAIPNITTKSINIAANSSAIVSIVAPLTLYGKETIRTQDGQTANNAGFYVQPISIYGNMYIIMILFLVLFVLPD